MLALEHTPAGKVIYLNADYEPVDKAGAVLARLVRPDGSVEVLALKPDRLELTRADFHLPGQHDQQDHAGGRGGAGKRDRSAETSGRWRHEDIDAGTLGNITESPERVRELESAFYNAEPETLDEMLGWTHLTELMDQQRAFEEAHPGVMGVRVDAPLKGRPADADMMHDAIDNERIAADGPAAAAWIAINGSEMLPPRSPPAIPLGRFKRCYDNALEFVRAHRGHKYCEGLVVDPKTKMAFQHAWAIDKKGQVVDPTLGWQPKVYYHGVVFPNWHVVKLARSHSDDLPTITFNSTKWLKKELKL